jgi:Fur family ferric uptake transcriptional regulator
MSETGNSRPKQRRSTAQRRVIHEELCAVKSHPTAAELYDLVRRRLPRVSLGTIYRNLEVLHEDGLVRKLEFAGIETRFDGTLKPHDHVRCTACGSIEDVFDLGPGARPANPAALVGYQVTGYRLEYFGICPDCQRRNRPDPAAAN